MILTNFTNREERNKIWGNSSSRLGFLTTTRITEGETTHNVMTIEWMSHIQFEPPRVMISLVKGYHSIELLQQTGNFGLTFASTNQVELIKQLGSVSGKDEDKFSKFKIPHRAGLKIPARVVTNGVMALECKVIREVELEQSIIFVGEILLAELWDNQPLGYHQGTIYEYGKSLSE